MVFLGFIEFIIALILVVVIITQVIAPTILGGQMFPMFRRKDLERQRREAEEELQRQLELQQIDAIRHQVDALKSHGDSQK